MYFFINSVKIVVWVRFGAEIITLNFLFCIKNRSLCEINSPDFLTRWGGVGFINKYGIYNMVI